MNDKNTLKRAALKAIQDVLLGVGMGKIAPLPSLRYGTCIVERCAQFIEASCRSCRGLDCRSCAIAAKLRTAEDRINAKRDAELDAGHSDASLDDCIDKIVENLCTEHGAFGSELAGQWYSRRSFLPAAAAVIDDASQGRDDAD
jgi:hypothetical protein